MAVSQAYLVVRVVYRVNFYFHVADLVFELLTNSKVPVDRVEGIS